MQSIFKCEYKLLMNKGDLVSEKEKWLSNERVHSFAYYFL